MKNEIIKKIERIIKLRELSQEELARKLHVDAATVSRWATGKSKPRKKHMFQLDNIENEKMYYEKIK